MTLPQLHPLDRAGVAEVQALVTRVHYLHKPVDPRCSAEGYDVWLPGIARPVGCLLLGRPQATRCGTWYGGVADAAAGRCAVTRWQVLNLARVWLHPMVQPGGTLFSPDLLPGFTDRLGVFRSTLGSRVLLALAARVGADYLVRRPPCFLDEPYELRWLLSYCDTRLHRGTLYAAAGFTLYRTNADGVQTWRLPLPALAPEEDAAVRHAAAVSPRSIAYRGARAQVDLFRSEAA